MRIAIAGTGDLAKYFVEELLSSSHSVVVLSRGQRDWFNRSDIKLRITDYSIGSLTEALQDCDGLVSALQINTLANIDVHLALLAACQSSPRCKRFIPSEYIGNLEEFPDQPLFYAGNHQPIRDKLAEQNDVEYTLFNPGWLADYIVPHKFRYIRDIGLYHPINFEEGTMIIPGTGNEKVCMTAFRDVARAIVCLFESNERWERVTYVCGEVTTWNSVREILGKEGVILNASYVPHEELERIFKETKDEEERVVAEFGLWSSSGSTFLPMQKVESQKEIFFKKVEFRGLRDLLIEIKQHEEGKIL